MVNLPDSRQRSSRTRNSEFYFPAREARGLSCLLPQLSQAGLEALCLMLVYDPENRAAARQLLEHRYFADTRERELPRQTRSTSSSRAQLHSDNVDQRGNPLVLSYLSSERHRKFRLLNACHSQLRYVDASKIARIVESTPDARSSVADAESRRPEPARIDDLRQTLVGRYFLRKRQSLQNNRHNTQQKKWYDSTVKFANLRYCDKKPYQRENIPTKTSVARPQQLSRQSFFLNDNRNNMQTNQEEKHFTSASKLPSIYLKRNRSSVCYVNSPMHISGDKSFQVNIATIHEHQSQGQPARKTSISKSPEQKIAKREISNDYHLRTTTFNSSKLSLRKSSQQRF